MNKAIQKMMTALAICGALVTAAQAGSQPIGTRASRAMLEPSGTAMAAPKGNPPPKGKAPTAQKATAQKPPAAKAPAHVRHTAHAQKAPGRAPAVAHHASMRPAPRHEIAHHAQPPPPHAKHHEPKHQHGRHHDCHCNGTLHTEDWCEIGASLIGGLIGASI